MTDERIIAYLNTLKNEYLDDEIKEVAETAIKAIKSKCRIQTELDKAIEKEKNVLSQFTNDFNHHLWIMRGLKVAKQIVEGEDYEKF